MLRGLAWGEAVAAVGVERGLRRDSAATLAKMAVALLAAAEGGPTSAPTWAKLAEAVGCDERTVGRWVAWLRQAGLLVTVEHGSTEQFRPRGMALEGNRAAVYLLTVPVPVPVPGRAGPVSDAAPVSVTERRVTPQASLPRERRRTPPHARTRARASPAEPLVAAGRTKDGRGGGGRQSSDRGRVGQGPRARRRAEQLAIAAAVRERSLDLRAISAAAVAAVARPLLDAGWGVADLVHAIDHTPDGAVRRFTAGPGVQPWAGLDVDRPGQSRRVERQSAPVGSPGGWLAWRLRPWAGHPPPAAARRTAAQAARAAAAAAAAARAACNAATIAAAAPPPVGFAAARRVLRENIGQRPTVVRRPWTPTR